MVYVLCLREELYKYIIPRIYHLVWFVNEQDFFKKDKG